MRSPLILMLILIPVVLAACAGSDDEAGLPAVDCAAVTVPRFAELTIWPLCTSCHASTVSGAARNLAPAHVNLDGYGNARTFAASSAVQVNVGKMPPAGRNQPSSAEKQALLYWASCGTPE